MWFCCNTGFLSVVADKNDASRLMVRARRKADLVAVVGEDAEIIATPDADYRWRTFLKRDRFKQIVASQIDAIDYTNFKGSVERRDLHDLYMGFWRLHNRYGA